MEAGWLVPALAVVGVLVAASRATSSELLAIH